MIRYTEENESLVFNGARQKACGALSLALSRLRGKEGVTELAFRDSWLEAMAAEGGIFADGWYCPPPRGTAVLSGDRVCFDSLRNPAYWSGDRALDWEEGLFYAYCSPVDTLTGTMGDLSVTMYFGRNEEIRNHVKRCREAVGEVFRSLEKAETAAELYRLSREVFRGYGLYSGVISRTDSMPSNLGHTFESLEGASEKDRLSPEDARKLSLSRRFLNGGADWPFTEGLQFTVEPQLLSLDDPSLPKVTQHYLVRAEADGFTVCNDIDRILLDAGQI